MKQFLRLLLPTLRHVSIDGWMDDLRFNVLFNNISVIQGGWADDKERLCAMEPIYGREDFASSRPQTRDH